MSVSGSLSQIVLTAGLRLAAATVALGWGLGGLPLLMPDAALWEWLGILAGSPLPYEPTLAYWVRMAACVCLLIATLAGWVAVDPKGSGPVAAVLAVFQVVTGMILFGWGYTLGVPTWPWIADVGFCLGTGIALGGCLIGVRLVGGTSP
ncbi:hypothetical protein LBMAG53_00920 [Planctomycetota bacterium]|nr:hypothetical protein LBMAG53_00920 [Planctomycetota bacterium]